MRKQVTFCEEGILTESLGASSWEKEEREVKYISIIMYSYVLCMYYVCCMYYVINSL